MIRWAKQFAVEPPCDEQLKPIAWEGPVQTVTIKEFANEPPSEFPGIGSKSMPVGQRHLQGSFFAMRNDRRTAE